MEIAQSSHKASQAALFGVGSILIRGWLAYGIRWKLEEYLLLDLICRAVVVVVVVVVVIVVVAVVVVEEVVVVVVESKQNEENGCCYHNDTMSL